MAEGDQHSCALFVVPVVSILIVMTCAAKIESTCAKLNSGQVFTISIIILMPVFAIAYSLSICGRPSENDVDFDITAHNKKWTLIFIVAVFIVFALSAGKLVRLSKVIGRSSAVSPNPVPGRPAYKEYRLDQFPASFRDGVLAQWNGSVSHCLIFYVSCDVVNATYDSLLRLSTAPLTALESGCCLPPQNCSFTFVSPIYWTSNQTSPLGGDCSNWNNDQLCFYCDSCKAALLAHITTSLRKVNKLTISGIVICGVFFLYSIWFLVVYANNIEPEA
ncbi:unnamed protein product [Cuscuta europaea]|uniref:Uncharacterized protein n=1 Tax=Cuscuta europaea TaxID=41803 RepID=A0A9P0ZM74_CUSEU|nr:unnamed protein product [Cuscuta europaea]